MPIGSHLEVARRVASEQGQVNGMRAAGDGERPAGAGPRFGEAEARPGPESDRPQIDPVRKTGLAKSFDGAGKPAPDIELQGAATDEADSAAGGAAARHLEDPAVDRASA